MTNRNHKEFDTSPWIDWFAGQIPSAVLRLRFLRAVMLPRQEDRHQKSYKSRFLVAFVAVLLLFLAPASAPRVRAPSGIQHLALAAAPRPATIQPATVQMEQSPEIWQVERTGAFETYSNGLRIDNRFSIGTRRRSYLAFSALRPKDIQGEHRSVPAGIVYHTTESLQVPFESGQNSKLNHIGESLLAYVRLKRAYNFVIDRFGRVYQVVLESDVANHAGDSIWSDREWVYVNLNQSFLGVSFETQTSPGQVEARVNPAQVRAAAMLTDMLRERYGIPAGNCITHAQVSVNISNLKIGYHTDWASSFPFEQLGLQDNYVLPLPAISLFGFEYDSKFKNQAGVRLYLEAQLADQLLRDRANAANLPVLAYRRVLQKRYWTLLTAVREDARRMDQQQ